MAIASLAIFSLAMTALADVFWLHPNIVLFWWISDPAGFRYSVVISLVALVASISGLTLGILSICLRRRRRMGIVGTVLNSIVVGFSSVYFSLSLWAIGPH